MQPLSFDRITVDEIYLDELKEKNLRVSVLRLDKIHPVISGNKWFKLKYWLEEAKKQQATHLLTFGGAYSNHILATAAAGKLYGFKTTGIIRGESPAELSPTLQMAKDFGMQFRFLTREEYRNKMLNEIMTQEKFVIPEGGYGELGVKGAAEISTCAKIKDHTHICCAVGTTTMMAGLIKSSGEQQEVIGLPVLKHENIENELQLLLPPNDAEKRYRFIHDYYFGGYAKRNSELIEFMNRFYEQTNIPTDFVYTGKLFFGILDLAKKNFFPGGSHLLIIHSGGLQGNASLPKDLLIF